jgi:hypothetical protein
MRLSRTAVLPILVGFVLLLGAATLFQQRNAPPMDSEEQSLDADSADATLASTADAPTTSLASVTEPLRRLPPILPPSKAAGPSDAAEAPAPVAEDLNQWAASYEAKRLREQLVTLTARARSGGADPDTLPSDDELAQFDTATLRLWIFLVSDQLKRSAAAAQAATAAAKTDSAARRSNRGSSSGRSDNKTRVVRDYRPSPFAAPGRMDHQSNRVPNAMEARYQGRAPFLTSTTESDQGTTVYIIDPYQPLYRITGPVRGGAAAGSHFNSSR